MKPLCIDFETKPIDDVPDGRFPEPVGMAISIPAFKRPRYFAWGHPSGNNCTLHAARVALSAAMFQSDTLIAFNIGFDAGVAMQHLHLPMDHLRWHDVQVMAFHHDPHARQLSLKPLAAEHAGMPDDEAQEVREWLIAAGIVKRSATRAWGAQIWQAPGDLVGKYAVGDVERTLALFRLWKRYVGTEGYERDMAATRVGLKMTQRGVPIDADNLDAMADRAQVELASVHHRLAQLFGMAVYDPHDKEAKADAIERLFGVGLPLTATGRRQVNKDALFDAVPDGEVKALLRYEAALGYDIRTYLLPWQRAVRVTGGRIHPNWSVTRSDDGGARTGRLASSPNFQNLRGVEGTEVMVEYLKSMHPAMDFWTPGIRSLVKAAPGKLIVGRDWSQIELRLTAHYEDGPMASNYRAEPTWDLHAWVQARVLAMFGVTLMRRIAKNIGFGSIYGAGNAPIAKQSRITLAEAESFRRMYFQALPSLRELMQEVQDTGRLRPIETLGKRLYAAEPPRYDPRLGRQMEFFYKLLNYLIQGSAADLMKEAMIDADKYGVPLILSVHDEPVSESNAADADDHLEALRIAMEHNDLIDRITVPITSNGYVAQRWSDAEK